MFEFYKDKTKLFECNVSITGSSIKESRSRLILKFPDVKYSIICEGVINQDGKCEIQVPALKNVNATKGTVTLEIITENMLFEPWNGDFELKNSVEIMVENVNEKKDKTQLNEKIEVKVSLKEDEVKRKEVTLKDEKLNILFKQNTSTEDKKFVSTIIKEYKELSADKKKLLLENLKKYTPSIHANVWSKINLQTANFTNSTLNLIKYQYDKKQTVK